jgi:hypothetical protein
MYNIFTTDFTFGLLEDVLHFVSEYFSPFARWANLIAVLGVALTLAQLWIGFLVASSMLVVLGNISKYCG